MLRSAMFAPILAAALAALATPPEPLKGQLQSAIWSDLQLNAMIGNSNWLGSLWYNAGSDTAPNLHVRELRCAEKREAQRCTFELRRDGSPATVLGETALVKLACVAVFAYRSDGWSVVHTPPRGAGHSKTSMQCKALKL